MSVKQGIKYDSPESKLEIPTFIAFHNLNVDEILDPIDSFRESPLSRDSCTFLTSRTIQKPSISSFTGNSNRTRGPLQTRKIPVDLCLARTAV